MTIRRTAGIAATATTPAAARTPAPIATPPRISGLGGDAGSVAATTSLAVSGYRPASDHAARAHDGSLRDIAMTYRFLQVPRALAAETRFENLDEIAVA